ncbi:MAG: RNA polymerase sigma factor RpoD/SigA [Spirochaetia bacterium]
MKTSKIQDENKALKQYFDQIKETQLLCFEQELELSKRIQNGDEKAKEQLIKANLRLVVKIAKAYVTKDISFLDIIQEGNVGLIKAASKYDYRKNVRFSTYASWWIKQSIVRSLSNKKRTIRLPHRKEETLKKIKKTYNLLSQKLMRTPTIEEISTELKVQTSEVIELLNITNTVASLDSTIGEDDTTLMDVYEDNSYSPDKLVIEKSVKEETVKFLEKLMSREKQILMYRFAFYGGKKLTLKKIGQEMGISPETVRQIELRAIRKLRKHADEISEFVYD